MDKPTSKIRSSLRIRILLVIITLILIVIMFPKGESIESEVTVGTIWTQDDLIASTTFEILKSSEVYEKQKLEAADNVHQIFIRDPEISKNTVDSLKNYESRLKNLLDEDIRSKEIDNSTKTILSNQSYDIFLKLRRQENILSSGSNKTIDDITNVSEEIMSRIYQRGLLNQYFDDIDKDSIAIREGKFEKVVPKRIFLDMNTVNNFVELYVRNNFTSNVDLSNAVNEYVHNFIKPNIIFNPRMTQDVIKNAQDKISRNVGIVNENERIVAKHDRITPEVKQKIDSYRIAKGEDSGTLERIMQNVGKFLHIVIILTLFIIYLSLFRKKIFHDNVKILLIIIIILFISFLTFLVHQINVQAPVQLLILIPAASMLLTIIFDSRVGFYGTVVIALIAGGLRGNDYVFTVMNIIAGALSAYTVRDIKNRSQIFRSFLFILIGYVVSIVAFGLESFDSVEQMLVNSAFAASNALISPVLTYGLIIFFERFFKITTELTLLEMTDFNRPLLKELARTAPGTFTHSMTMGTLVENAAEAIGANTILARVGAYYHDIGKTLEPNAFVENQMDNMNIHENLDPRKSAEVIINHVKRGMELAREHKLPDEIIDFIPMHHGTMVISFFYEKAKEEYGEENVDIDEFRYPGPKPNTKETALVMLADACESTIRSMSEPDPKKVENVVNNLLKMRIDDGQLDDSPITLRDIKKIKEAFLSILVGQHHKRIRYPKQEEMENNSEQK